MKNKFSAYGITKKLGYAVLDASGSGTFDGEAVDCPFVFEHNGAVKMLYVGFNGVGYQTGLAYAATPDAAFTSEALLLARGDGEGWDARNASGNWLLCGNDLWKPRTLQKWDGKYWMTYHSYPQDGYEAGPGAIGLAYCENESLREWKRLPQPILRPEEGEDWERGGLYKSCLLRHDGLFYLFYNAKNEPPEGEMWREQTGVATSPDLVTWTRHDLNPLLRVGALGSWDSLFASEPCVFYDSRAGYWVMFYFGFDGNHAQEGVAISSDLLHWEKSLCPIITVDGKGGFDETHAHKPSVYYKDGVLYHYYCACRPIREGDPAFGITPEHRCITVAWAAV